MTDMSQSIATLRPQLLGYARSQLRSDAAAEDAVQEALLAALQGASGFTGAATLKTWVFAILRNKIIDDIRHREREPELTPAVDEDGNSPEEIFSSDGSWAEQPNSWGDPEASLEQCQFWAVFKTCLDDIPPKPGCVFMMREFLGLSTDEICAELGITTSNCWVLLHRARLGLRKSLAARWFGKVLH